MLGVLAVLTGFFLLLNLAVVVADERRRRLVRLEQESRDRTVSDLREAAIRDFRERQTTSAVG